MVCAALVPLAAAGVAGIVALLLTGAGAVVVTVAGIYWFLISRGFLRWCALALAVLAPLVVVFLYVQAGLLLEVMIAVGLVFVAVVCARAALREPRDRIEDDRVPCSCLAASLPGDESAQRRGQGGEV